MADVTEYNLTTKKTVQRDYTEKERADFARIKAEHKPTYQELRREEYPAIGDQLDAIWKELNYRRMNGDNLTADADLMLGKILSVKAKYPKP